jgi:hypothetical protein
MIWNPALFSFSSDARLPPVVSSLEDLDRHPSSTGTFTSFARRAHLRGRTGQRLDGFVSKQTSSGRGWLRLQRGDQLLVVGQSPRVSFLG